MGELVLGRRMGNRALAWGAFFGTLPDLDVLVAPLLDTAGNLWWHRGPSHSLLVMIAASWFLSPWLARWWRRDKVSRSRAGWFVFAAWSTHVLIDCFTVYGTSVFWPFPLPRTGLDLLFIIDPLFTLPMMVALVWLAFLRDRKSAPRRMHINLCGLGVSTAYVLLSCLAKHSVSGEFKADLQRRGVVPQATMEAPTPFNIVLWRAVADCGDSFWIGYRSVLDRESTPVRWTVIPKRQEELGDLAATREGRRLKWFTGGWWIARAHRKGVWVGDLRFGEACTWQTRKGVVDLRPAFSWDLLREESGDRLRGHFARRQDAGDQLRRIARRAMGDRSAWEAPPRLEGVTGSLPESLEWRE
jgi:inner membrane protein